MNNLIKKKEAQQTHLSQELISEAGQSLPGMFLHSGKKNKKNKNFRITVFRPLVGLGYKKKKRLWLKSLTPSLLPTGALRTH